MEKKEAFYNEEFKKLSGSMHENDIRALEMKFQVESAATLNTDEEETKS